MMHVLFILLGVALLTAGGEALIRGSLAAANRLAVSPLLSGLLIVGFGTSMPELVVSVTAAIHNQPDIAIGNVVGSNISNVLLILGICALIAPMTVKPIVLRRDAVIVIAVSLLFVVLAVSGELGRADGVILLTVLVAFVVLTYRSERVDTTGTAELHKAEAAELTALPESGILTVAMITGGIILLIAGSQVLLSGAIGIAKNLGISEAVIALTFVAVGTSIPELTISVMAALRKHADVAIGNVLGSNIFNILGILGVATLVRPLPVPARVLHFDQWIMLGTSLLLVVFLFPTSRLSRTEGAMLLFSYAIYVGLSFTSIVA